MILRFFLCIPASATDAAAVNPNGINTLLANGWITLFINGNPVLSNEPRILPRNLPNCTILDNWVFDSLILTDELCAKALWRFLTCLSVNNNLCGRLVSTSQLNNLKALYLNYCTELFYIDIMLHKIKLLYNTFTIPSQFFVKSPK